MNNKIVPRNILAQEEVKSSSSDNTYIVTIFDNCISCTCPAGGRKTFCKHMLTIVHQNLEQIEKVNLEFYKDLILLLEMKNDKNQDYEAFKELSAKLIHSDKGIAQQAALNSVAYSENRKNKNNFAEIVANDINNIDIHKQFEFFEILCKAYNKKEIGFRYCEYPNNLDEFIKMGYLINTEQPPKLSDFIKMDAGRKSVYFFKLSPEIIEIRRKLHEILSVKFPKIEQWSKDGLWFTEKRIIDPKYL